MKEYDFDKVHDIRPLNGIKWNAYPKDVLPLWIADSDFLSPKEVVDAVTKRAQAGSYSYPDETENFHEAVKYWLSTRHNWKVENEDITFTYTVVAALCDIVRAFTKEGDAILIMPPIYPPFHQIIDSMNRTKVCSAMQEDAGKWTIDFNDLEKKLADPKLKVFFFCTPHNPSGRVFTREELDKVNELCLKYNVLVVADEIHGDIVYKPNLFIPFATLSPKAAENSIILTSTSKSFNTPGLRIAVAIISNKILRDKFRDSMEKNKTADMTIFGLVALEAAYKHGASYLAELLEYLEANRDFAVDYINKQIPHIKTHTPEGTFLLWLDCSALGLSSEELTKFMLEKAKVALNEGIAFGEEGKSHLRLNFACSRKTLEEALKRIENAVKSM